MVRTPAAQGRRWSRADRPSAGPAGYRDLPYAELLALFNEGAAIDALDTAQILRHDVILWLFLLAYGGLLSSSAEPGPRLSRLYRALADGAEPDLAVTKAAGERWGI